MTLYALATVPSGCVLDTNAEDFVPAQSQAALTYELLLSPQLVATLPAGVPSPVLDALHAQQMQLEGGLDKPYVMDPLALSMLLSELSQCEASLDDPTIEQPPWFVSPQDWQFVGRVRISETGPEGDEGFVETQSDPPEPEGDFADLPLWKQWLEAQRERAILLDMDTRLAFRSRVDLFARRNEILINAPDRDQGPAPQLGGEEDAEGSPEDDPSAPLSAAFTGEHAGSMQPRKLFGTDGRLHVQDTTVNPWRRAAAMRFRNPTNDDVEDGSDCSAAFAGPRHLWTAAHCATDSAVAFTTSVVPGQNGDGFGPDETPYGTFAVRYVIYPQAYNNDPGSATYDWALIVLRSTAGYPRWFGSQSATFGQLKNRAHRAIGYPGDVFDFKYVGCADSPQAGLFCGDRQYQQLADIDEVPSTRLRSRHDAVGGQSGSGIVRFTDSFSTNYVRGILNKGNSSWTYSRRLTNYNLQYLCDFLESLPSSEHEASCE